MKDRIEQTYEAIDEMAAMDGQPRPNKFGGGYWNAVEEFDIYLKQIGSKYTPIQLNMFALYFANKLKEVHTH